MAHQKGFTLLEVMLVMVIIALAAAGVVAMQSDRLSATGKLLRQIDVLRQTAKYMSDVALLENILSAFSSLLTAGFSMHRKRITPVNGSGRK